eukprot:216581-Rhodomonas_salina.1
MERQRATRAATSGLPLHTISMFCQSQAPHALCQYSSTPGQRRQFRARRAASQRQYQWQGAVVELENQDQDAL